MKNNSVNVLKNPKRYDLRVMTVYGFKRVFYYNNNGWSSHNVAFNHSKIRKNYKKVGSENDETFYRLKSNFR